MNLSYDMNESYTVTNTLICTRNPLTWCIIKNINVYIKIWPQVPKAVTWMYFFFFKHGLSGLHYSRFHTCPSPFRHLYISTFDIRRGFTLIHTWSDISRIKGGFRGWISVAAVTLFWFDRRQHAGRTGRTYRDHLKCCCSNASYIPLQSQHPHRSMKDWCIRDKWKKQRRTNKKGISNDRITGESVFFAVYI